MPPESNPFGTRATMDLGGDRAVVYRLAELSRQGLGHADRLPMKEPFYPGVVGVWSPNGIADPSHPEYKDQLWDLE